MKYLMIRNNIWQSREEKCLKEGYVAYGWSYVNFKECKENGKTSDELIQIIKDAKYSLGRKKNMIRYFYEIEEGDRIVVPTYRGFYLAIALGELEYDSESDKDKIDKSNLQKVKYVKDEDGNPIVFARAGKNTAFESMLKFRGCKYIWEEDYKKIIEDLIKNKKDESTSSKIENAENIALDNLKKLISEHLMNYSKTSFDAGGEGFENFLCELFKLYGFKVKRLNKKDYTPGIDADLFIYKEIVSVSTKTMLLDDFKYGCYIQAKHHQGNGEIGIGWAKNQIDKYKEEKKKEADDTDNGMIKEEIDSEEIEIPFENIKYMVITTAENISEKGENQIDETTVSVIDNELLTDMIYEKWNELGEKKNVLNICTKYESFE